jgi:hypothetical protein
LRKYLENLTGVATGSDQNMFFQMNLALQFCGFKGEGIIDDRIWISKSHFPITFPFEMPYKTQLVICCVRNPIDAFVSTFHLMSTMAHNVTANDDCFNLPEWDNVVR